MDRKREAISVLSNEKRVVNKKYSSLLDDLIRNVESLDFDPREFSDLYLELLTCTSQIFELEKKSYVVEGEHAFHQPPLPYRAFRAQLARLNEKCREKGIGHSHSMLEFLLEWFSKRYEVPGEEPEIRGNELIFA